MANQDISHTHSTPTIAGTMFPHWVTENNHPPHHQEDSAAPLAWPAAMRLRAFANVLLGTRRRFLPRRCVDHRRHHHRNDDKECEPAGYVQGYL